MTRMPTVAFLGNPKNTSMEGRREWNYHKLENYYNTLLIPLGIESDGLRMVAEERMNP